MPICKNSFYVKEEKEAVYDSENEISEENKNIPSFKIEPKKAAPET